MNNVIDRPSVDRFKPHFIPQRHEREIAQQLTSFLFGACPLDESQWARGNFPPLKLKTDGTHWPCQPPCCRVWALDLGTCTDLRPGVRGWCHGALDTEMQPQWESVWSWGTLVRTSGIQGWHLWGASCSIRAWCGGSGILRGPIWWWDVGLLSCPHDPYKPAFLWLGSLEIL